MCLSFDTPPFFIITLFVVRYSSVMLSSVISTLIYLKQITNTS